LTLPEISGVSRDGVVETTIYGNWKRLLEFGFTVNKNSIVLLPWEARSGGTIYKSTMTIRFRYKEKIV